MECKMEEKKFVANQARTENVIGGKRVIRGCVHYLKHRTRGY